MGEVIELKDQLADRSRPTSSYPGAFFYDVGCPFSYLAAERIERTLGEIDWVPVRAAALDDAARWTRFEATRVLAERQARLVRLPLVWPERFPADRPTALRVATYAAEHGASARFALAATRLVFCGGFDLEDPEIIAVAAAVSGIPLEGCLAAADDDRRDDQLRATAGGLRTRGVRRLPAIRVGRRWFEGTRALEEAAALMGARAL